MQGTPAEARAARARAREGAQRRRRALGGMAGSTPIPVNPAALAPSGSYDEPDFVRRGTYLDVPFTCRDCGAPQVWTAAQQRWWSEVARGGRFTTATRCRPCRRAERALREAARSTHLEGLACKRDG